MPLRLALAVLVAAALVAVARLPAPDATPMLAQWPRASAGVDLAHLQVQAHGDVPMPEVTPAAHASALLAMPSGGDAALSVFWFAGTRESAADVQIVASQWSRSAQRWLAARPVLERHALGAQLGFGVRRLGNPVPWLDAQGRIHLFVVATGWGGWAASRIVHLRQSSTRSDLAQLQFEPLRVLALSWWWNTSFLVRNAVLPLADGGMLLPVYFELGIKYPVALRFDQDGVLRGMQRMSARRDALQPTLLMRSPTEWLALLRDVRPLGKIGVVGSDDAGQHWSDLPDLPLDNPDAAVAALALAPQQMLLAYNPSTSARSQLDLSHSAEGRQWTRLATLAQGHTGDEYSYPSMAWADGSLWVSYTANRQRIAWQRFGLPPEAQP
ncbi:MAG: exo-alpha-sialidase [Rhodoferax sp.]